MSARETFKEVGFYAVLILGLLGLLAANITPFIIGYRWSLQGSYVEAICVVVFIIVVLAQSVAILILTMRRSLHTYVRLAAVFGAVIGIAHSALLGASLLPIPPFMLLILGIYSTSTLSAPPILAQLETLFIYLILSLLSIYFLHRYEEGGYGAVPLNAVAMLLGGFFVWIGAYPLLSWPLIIWLYFMPKKEKVMKLAAVQKEGWKAIRDEQL